MASNSHAPGERAGLNWQRLGLRLAGAGLLAGTGAIHLDLYLTGYRSIPMIGNSAAVRRGQPAWQLPPHAA